MGRILGFALIAGGFLVGVIVVVLMSVYRSEGSLSAGAATLGAALGIIVLVLPQLGVGAFLIWKGGQETAVSATAAQQRKILDMVKSRGQIDISDLVIELGSTKDEVHDMIHQSCGHGVIHRVYQLGRRYAILTRSG